MRDNLNSDVSRNESIPLYYWIKSFGGINHVSQRGRTIGRVIGWHFADDVLKRLVKIKKLTPNNFAKVSKKAVHKFNTAWQHMPHDYIYFKDTNGKFVDYDDYDKGIMVIIINEYDNEEVRVQR